MEKNDKELLEALKDLKDDNDEAIFQFEWVLKKVMKLTDRDIELNKAITKSEIRMKKLKRILGEDGL